MSSRKVTRRQFIDLAAGTSVLAGASARASRSHGGVQGANDRVRVALIGAGGRGRQVALYFLRHPDCEMVAAAEVYKTRLDEAIARLTEARPGMKVDAYEDYRRILDRRDVDAVLIATPDHWHCPMTIDACAAGKDVYVEKPLSNEIEPAWKAVEAARKHQRVVQMGTQQRQGKAFKEAADIVRSGTLGTVTHVVLQFRGNYGVPPEPSAAPPQGLNWDAFQGPAPRRPFRPGRLRWRNFYDYGGGLVTDWGVHLVDVAHWYLNAERKAPLLTSAAAQYVLLDNPGRDQCPDAFSISWHYDDFVMSFTNAVVQDWEFGRHGTYFFGPRGSLLIHRSGFEIRPYPVDRRRQPSSGEPLEPRRRPYVDNYDDDPDTIAHVREFLDCMKSRARPSSEIEVGYYSSLPTLLAIHAIRDGRAFKYDAVAHRAVAV
jgi:predicted dehydrogenase